MLIFAKYIINIAQNLAKGLNPMQTIEKDFSAVTQKLGYGEVASKAGVSYQAVSNFAAEPRPGHKYRVRLRILDVVIASAESRVSQLRAEADQLEKQITGLKEWKTEFGK